jgi:hypothetical protein
MLDDLQKGTISTGLNVSLVIMGHGPYIRGVSVYLLEQWYKKIFENL